jgi:protein phosphatase
LFDFFKNLLTEKNNQRLEVDSSASMTAGEFVSKPGPKTKTGYKVASCQSSGRERTHNEDTLLTLNCLIDGMDSPVSFGVFLVADGMGGHQSGEVASRLAVQASSQYIMQALYNGFVYDQDRFSTEEIHHVLNEAVESAQKIINQRVPGGGTTLTLVIVLDDRLFFGHVGDSRLYKIDFEGKFELLTKDHSLVKRLIDLGEIAESEASSHPQRNVLYRALGQIDPFEPDIGHFSLDKGEGFLICSDGLWGVVQQEKLVEIINQRETPIEQRACDLVDAANEAGGPDNISLILVERLK